MQIVEKSRREGRFLILLVGDGIREGIQSLTELVNRNATKAFTFGVVEFATYRFGKDRFAVQPRILAETEMLMRHLTIVNMNAVEDTDEQEQTQRDTSDAKAYHDQFWKPLLRMKFDDPEQDTPIYIPATYNLSLRTPFLGIRIKAYAQYKGDQIGVFLSETRAGNLDTLIPFIKRNRRYLAEGGEAGQDSGRAVGQIRVCHKSSNRAGTGHRGAVRAPLDRRRRDRVGSFSATRNVCFWHKADIPTHLVNVCFWG
jgi:hypothetical protein